MKEVATLQRIQQSLARQLRDRYQHLSRTDIKMRRSSLFFAAAFACAGAVGDSSLTSRRHYLALVFDGWCDITRGFVMLHTDSSPELPVVRLLLWTASSSSQAWVNTACTSLVSQHLFVSPRVERAVVYLRIKV